MTLEQLRIIVAVAAGDVLALGDRDENAELLQRHRGPITWSS